jgi:hypothetical protein
MSSTWNELPVESNRSTVERLLPPWNWVYFRRMMIEPERGLVETPSCPRQDLDNSIVADNSVPCLL